MPLPTGRVRFYRCDTDGRLEFTGEDSIDHAPKDEKTRVFTGAAFDLTGERKRSLFRNDMGRSEMDEAFEIKVREHLYRWNDWTITSSSMPYTKTTLRPSNFTRLCSPARKRRSGTPRTIRGERRFFG